MDEQLELFKPEPKKKRGGFNSPETNQKAQEKSLQTRRQNKQNTLEKLFNEDYDPDVPVTVTEKDVESFKDTVIGFIPSIPQLKILAVALSLDHGTSIKAWFKAAGHNRNDWYFWIKNPDFVTWWNKAFKKGIEQYRSEWIAIGIKRMKNIGDPKAFDYWKTAGEKIFGFIQQISVKEDRSKEEEELTNELLDLVKGINAERKMQIVDGEVVDVEKLEEELVELEKPKEIDNNATSSIS